MTEFIDKDTELHCVGTNVTSRFNNGKPINGTFRYAGNCMSDQWKDGMDGYWYSKEGYESMCVGMFVIVMAFTFAGSLLGWISGRYRI